MLPISYTVTAGNLFGRVTSHFASLAGYTRYSLHHHTRPIYRSPCLYIPPCPSRSPFSTVLFIDLSVTPPFPSPGMWWCLTSHPKKTSQTRAPQGGIILHVIPSTSCSFFSLPLLAQDAAFFTIFTFSRSHLLFTRMSKNHSNTRDRPFCSTRENQHQHQYQYIVNLRQVYLFWTVPSSSKTGPIPLC